MRKYILFVLILLSFLCTNVYADEYEYVIDNGGILKNETKEYIEMYSNYLNETADIEYYVFTVTSLGEYDIDTYADIVYSDYVHNKKDNGLILLVSKNNRQVKVLAGKGISRVITNNIINKYIDDYIVSYISEDNWDSGIKNGYTAFFKYICNYLDIDSSELAVVNGNSFLYKYRYYLFFVCVFICNIIGYILPKYFMRLLNKKSKVNIIDNLIFCGAIFVNVVILYYNYIFMKNFLYAIFLFELFAILSSTVLKINYDDKKTTKKRNSHKHR